MKKIKAVSLFVVVLATLFAATTVQALSTPLASEETVSSAGPAVPGAPVKKLLNPPAPAKISMTPVWLPALYAPTWSPQADSVIAGGIAGTLAGYPIIADHAIGWTNLIETAAADSEGMLPWDLIKMDSVSGSDDIALSDLTVVITSPSDGNILGDTLSFTDKTYTPRAVAIKADGSMITSGSSTQKGKTVLVLVASKFFNNADTVAGQNQDKDWILKHLPYLMKYVATAGASTESSVTLSTSPVAVPRPILAINSNGSTGSLMVVNGINGVSYRIDAAPSAAGPWTFAAVANGTNSIPVAFTGTSEFYRASAQ